MNIGIPRERKANEKRVGITPAATKVLTEAGHQILIEEGAGIGSGFLDSDYLSAGAKIAASLREVWNFSELLMKVKEPAPEEYDFFRKGLLVYSFLHPASSQALTENMLKGEIIGIDYDLIQNSDGKLPILEPMSKIAGILAVQCGTEYLLSQNNGQGILLDRIDTDLPSTQVVIIGAGTSGLSAAKRALLTGASVTLLDINEARLKQVKKEFPDINTLFSNQANIQEAIAFADLVIGAVLIPGAKAPILIKRTDLKKCKPHMVFVDISIDQGGISETSIATSLSNPTYIEENIIHYCVPNMPAMVPKTATQCLSTQTLPWLKKIAELGIEKAIDNVVEISRSIVCYNGQLTNKEVGQAFGIEHLEIQNRI